MIFFYSLIYCYLWYNYSDFFLFLYDRGWMDGRFVSEHTPHSLSASGNTDWTVCGIFSGVGVSRPVSTRPGERKWRCPRSPSAPRGPWGASSVARTRWTVCADGTTPTPPHLAPSVDTTTVPRGTSPPIRGLLRTSSSTSSTPAITLSNTGIVL